MSARFVLDVCHITCNQVPAPLMILERTENTIGVYVCPVCRHKISIFNKPRPVVGDSADHPHEVKTWYRTRPAAPDAP